MMSNYLVHSWEKIFGKPPIGWSYKSISSLLAERNEFHSNDGVYPLFSLTIENGITPKTDRYNREFLLSDAESNQYKIVRPNDIAYNPMNLRFGALAVSKYQFSVMVSPYYNILEVDRLKADARFLSNLLLSDRLMYLYEKIASGSLNEKKRVHFSDFRNLLIPLPPLLEQHKISEMLGVWDESIDLLEKLIGKTRSRKQGLMQQLLTGKKRFKEFEGSEWKTVRLRDISTINYGKSPKNIFCDDGEFPVYGTGGITGYTSTHIYNGESVIIGRKGTIDKVRYITGKFWAIDTTYYLECKEIAKVKWVYYFLSSANLAELNEASGVPSLNRDTLYAIKFKIPSLPEQEKIAAVLSAADEEISTLEKQLAAYKQQKLGLMQQLLTGRIRI